MKTAAAEIVTVPCLADNYAFLLHDSARGATAAIDVPEAGPLLAALVDRGWTLTDILITHHHFDHIDGVDELREATGARVVGAKADEHRLPKLDLAVAEGDTVSVGGLSGDVFDVSGHTIGHIAFHFAEAKAAFTADSLMALGCGRLFEGAPEMMWDSMQKLRALPADTRICSGHEYTASNARFALSIEPENAALISRVQQITDARSAGRATVPSLLSEERETNPFLRADHPDLIAAIGMEGQDPAAIFAEVRKRKDAF